MNKIVISVNINNKGGSTNGTQGHPGFSSHPSSGFSYGWSGDPNETFKMFFGNQNPFGSFSDEDDDMNGFGGGFPGMFRFPGSSFGGVPGGLHQQMGAQTSSKVIINIILLN
jgi:hypothetical protein